MQHLNKIINDTLNQFGQGIIIIITTIYLFIFSSAQAIQYACSLSFPEASFTEVCFTEGRVITACRENVRSITL